MPDPHEVDEETFAHIIYDGVRNTGMDVEVITRLVRQRDAESMRIALRMVKREVSQLIANCEEN